MKRRTPTTLAILVLALGVQAAVAQDIFTASGANAAAIEAARAAYRAELGGGDTAAGGGLFGLVRREINWDGAGDAAADPNFMPANQFVARGVLFTTGGEGVKMSAKAVNPTNTPIVFASISASYAAQFAAFTAERTFAPIGSNRIDVTFTVPNTETPALTRGLGVVFSDVDLDFTTSIEYFALDGTSLGKFFVPAANGNQTFSFLGVAYALPLVARAEIVLGNVQLNQFGEIPLVQDVVITDDFIYGEPVAAPAVPCLGNANTLCFNNGRFEVTVEFATTAGGERKSARVQRLGADSGALWFFSPNNNEMLVKVLNACAINNRFWVYAAAATDVEFEITVTDKEENVTKTYQNAFGTRAAAITDTDAFATCP